MVKIIVLLLMEMYHRFFGKGHIEKKLPFLGQERRSYVFVKVATHR